MGAPTHSALLRVGEAAVKAGSNLHFDGTPQEVALVFHTATDARAFHRAVYEARLICAAPPTVSEDG